MGVTLDTLKDVIRINDLKTVEEITDYTKAGAFCKSCIKPGGHEEKDIYLVDILADASASGEATFDKMTIVQIIKTVDAVIDTDIRPMLQMDGGDMEIIDIKENMPFYDIYIRYLGACSGCASGDTGTLYAIEAVLKQKVDENIRVLPV